MGPEGGRGPAGAEGPAGDQGLPGGNMPGGFLDFYADSTVTGDSIVRICFDTNQSFSDGWAYTVSIPLSDYFSGGTVSATRPSFPITPVGKITLRR